MKMKKAISLKYNNKLILEILKSNLSGIIAANGIAMTITIAVLFNDVPNSLLSFFVFLHISLAILRLYIGKRLSLSIAKDNNANINKYLYIYTGITSITALSFGVMAFFGVLYGVPDINIFIIGITLTTITAGALATLASVYFLFLSFLLCSLLPFIFVLLLHGGMAFYIFAIILSVYIVVNSISAYKMYLNYKSVLLLQEKFKTIYDNSADGIALIKNNKIVECNQTTMKMFGYDENMQQFLNIKLSTLMPPFQEDGTNSMKKMLLMLKKTRQGTHTFEWAHLKKNGEMFFVDITLSIIEINNEEYIHGIWRDITYRKKIEDEIIALNKNLKYEIKKQVDINRQKDKMMIQQSRLAQMGEMISMIAHQWRQPLTAISAASGTLMLKSQLDQLDNKSVEQLSEKITQYTQHLSTTIDDFRDFFKQNKEKRETSYKKLINSVLNIVEVSIKNRNITLQIKIENEIIFYTYNNELKQVILNLIKNAEDVFKEKAIENPVITIEADGYTLRVKDNAGGVPKNIIDKVFEPYFSTKSLNGTGLGLYMSKTIVEDHCGGKLSVYNDDEGAVFEIKLPVVKDERGEGE